MKNTLKPARNISPGYFIREQMELREWSEEVLAQNLGLSMTELYPLLKSESPMSPEMAVRLAACFGQSDVYWMNLDGLYRNWNTCNYFM